MLLEEMDNTKNDTANKKYGLPDAYVAVLGRTSGPVRRMTRRTAPFMG